MNEAGLSDFSTLRSAMRLQPERLVFVDFDLLYLDGKDPRPRPLIERRAALEKLIGDASGAIQFSRQSAAVGMPSTRRSTGWVSRRWCRSAPARHTAAAAPKAG
jgi:ATP-dependent DNA ligase